MAAPTQHQANGSLELQSRAEASTTTTTTAAESHLQPAKSIEDDATVELGEAVSAPPTAVAALQRWNSSPINVWRLCAAFLTFAVMGANDAAYGVRIFLMIPSIFEERMF